jgi:hypothetical protein
MRPLLIALLILIPGVATAQPAAVRASADRLATLAAAAADSETRTTLDQTTQRTPAPAARAGGRRRPSMVGYIGDATIGPQIRVRFDAGFELNAPDRAEVFYGKCGCYRDLPVNHLAFDPEASGPGPGIAEELEYQQLYVLGEFAMNGRVSLYGELPVRWVQPQSFVAGTGSFGNQSGLSDLRAGLKVALAATDDQYVTVQLQTDAPSGESEKGLGTDHWTVAPALLYFQRLGERVAVESQFGSAHPIGGSPGIPASNTEGFAGSYLMYGIGASVELAPGANVGFAPVVELVGWHVLSGFQTIDFDEADGTNIVNLKIGARLSAGDHGSFYVGYGRALTDAFWYHDIVRVEYRWGF